MAVNKDQLIVKAIKTNSAKLEQLNVRQMEYGFTAKGKRIKPLYFSKEYAKGKRSIGSKAPLRVPDLRVTGAFHRGIKIIIGKKKYYLTSRDLKTVDLRKKYDYIFGLSPKSQKTAKGLTTKTFSLLWRKKVGLS